MSELEEQERSLAKIASADFEIEDHGIPVWSVYFQYDDGSGQGLGGYVAETGFMMRFLGAVGVSALSLLKGKSCWVTHGYSSISKIEPLHKKDGEPFVIAEWQKWVKERLSSISPYEMRTGKRP